MHITKDSRSKVCCRVGRCSKKHHTLLHPPIDNSFHGPHIYQNFYHATDSDNAEISKPPNEAKAIVHTQIGNCHSFLQVIPIISNRPLSIEKKCLLGLWMRHNFVKKGYCWNINLESSEQPSVSLGTDRPPLVNQIPPIFSILMPSYINQVI